MSNRLYKAAVLVFLILIAIFLYLRRGELRRDARHPADEWAVLEEKIESLETKLEQSEKQREMIRRELTDAESSMDEKISGYQVIMERIRGLESGIEETREENRALLDRLGVLTDNMEKHALLADGFEAEIEDIERMIGESEEKKKDALNSLNAAGEELVVIAGTGDGDIERVKEDLENTRKIKEDIRNKNEKIRKKAENIYELYEEELGLKAEADFEELKGYFTKTEDFKSRITESLEDFKTRVEKAEERYLARVEEKDESEEITIPPMEGRTDVFELANFNARQEKNLIGGGFGVWEKDPHDRTQSCKMEFISSVRRGDTGSSLKLIYDVNSPNEAYNGFWMDLKRVNLAPYEYYVVDVKGDSVAGFTDRFKVELKDSHGETQSFLLTGVSDKWQEKKIPLNYFDRIDLSSVSQFVIVFEDTVSSPRSGIIYLNSIFVE